MRSFKNFLILDNIKDPNIKELILALEAVEDLPPGSKLIAPKSNSGAAEFIKTIFNVINNLDSEEVTRIGHDLSPLSGRNLPSQNLSIISHAIKDSIVRNKRVDHGVHYVSNKNIPLTDSKQEYSFLSLLESNDAPDGIYGKLKSAMIILWNSIKNLDIGDGAAFLMLLWRIKTVALPAMKVAGGWKVEVALELLGYIASCIAILQNSAKAYEEKQGPKAIRRVRHKYANI